MQKRFVSWVAVSSLPQAKKISLDEQRKVNLEHIAKHNGVLVADLAVQGQSRNIVLWEDACKRIEAYAQLRELIKRRAFDVLIHLDRSRLGRTASLSMAVVELCREAGILVYETESPPTHLNNGEVASYDEMLVGAIKSVGAQREIIKLQERHKMGMIGRIKRGEFPAAVPWGWIVRYGEYGRRTVELDPVVAPLLREIFLEMFLKQGVGRRQIAELLNQRGIPSPQGKTWHTQNSSALFHRLWRYAGWSEINVRGTRPYVRARGNWPPILTQDEAEAVDAEIQMRRNARRAISNTYLFSLCVWCLPCKRRMVMNTTVRQRTSRRIQKSLVCKNFHPGGQISEPKTIRAVRAAIESLQDPANRAVVLQTTPDESESIPAEIAAQTAAIERAQAGLLRADDAYVAGTMDHERYTRQAERLNLQIEQAGQRIEQLRHRLEEEHNQAKRAKRLEELATDGLRMLDNPDVKAANAFMRKHIRLWVEANQVVEVEYL